MGGDANGRRRSSSVTVVRARRPPMKSACVAQEATYVGIMGRLLSLIVVVSGAFSFPELPWNLPILLVWPLILY